MNMYKYMQFIYGLRLTSPPPLCNVSIPKQGPGQGKAKSREKHISVFLPCAKSAHYSCRFLLLKMRPIGVSSPGVAGAREGLPLRPSCPGPVEYSEGVGGGPLLAKLVS